MNTSFGPGVSVFLVQLIQIQNTTRVARRGGIPGNTPKLIIMRTLKYKVQFFISWLI